ncbi:PepSY domain-containing protein [Alkalibacillus silvisoli]
MKQNQITWLIIGTIMTVIIFIIAQQFVFSTASAEQLSQQEAERQVNERFQGKITEVRETNSHYEFEIELKTGVYRVLVEKENGYIDRVIREEIYEGEQQENEEVEEEQSPEESDPGALQEDNDEEIEEEPQEDEEANEDEPTILSYEEMTTIALNEQSGEVTYLELVESEQPYYEITVEDDEMIYEMMIDAYEGSVLSLESERKTPETVVTEEEAIEIGLSEIEGDVLEIDLREVDGGLYYFITIAINEEEQATAQINAFSGEIHSVAFDEREIEEEDEEEEEEEE